ncbi:MAG: hypothetical protein ACLUEK_12570 [Oscillospiraceae bacterium]
MRKVRPAGDRAVEVEGLPTAFVCGVFRPVLAVPKAAWTTRCCSTSCCTQVFDAAQGIFWCLIRALHWCNPFMHYVLTAWATISSPSATSACWTPRARNGANTEAYCSAWRT